MIQLSKSFLIIADGEFLATKQIKQLAQNKVIIALDHASECLLELGILPDVILGDFDSIADKAYLGINSFAGMDDATRSIKLKGKSIELVYRPNQDETDFYKAIRYIDLFNPQDIHVGCALSNNRLDHLINNLRALKFFYQKKRPIYFYTRTQVARYIKDELIKVKNAKIGANCGILGFPSAHFSSKGLKYNGDNYPLSFGESESISNEFASKTAEIKVVGEALFIQDLDKNPLI